MDHDHCFCWFNLSQISDMNYETLTNSAIHRQTPEVSKVDIVNGNNKFGVMVCKLHNSTLLTLHLWYQVFC